jgi:AAA15 family ATPase/GTPase
MKIKSIELKNGYKRFHHLTIDLGDTPARIVALVGPNGCGKSSVFDGMLFSIGSHQVVGENSQNRSYEYHSMRNEPKFSYNNVEIKFVSGSLLDILKPLHANGRAGTLFSFRSPYRYNSNLMIKSSHSTPEIRLNNYGASFSADLDDKMEQNYRRLYIKYNTFLHETDCRPSEAKLKIIGDLNEAITNCLDLEIISIGDIESSKGTLFFQKTDHSSEFSFNVISSGEKEVVDILLDLYLRADKYNDTIFLIDEPELHISTSIQRSLLLEINKLGTRKNLSLLSEL